MIDLIDWADIGQREDEWAQKVKSKPRLRTYKLIKDKLEFEWYLEFVTGARKTALVEMRSGANDLEIEQGRRSKVEVKTGYAASANQELKMRYMWCSNVRRMSISGKRW